MADSRDSSIDPAMLELFQAEMDTHIPVLNQGLLTLEKGVAGPGDIEAMMRAAHSIKGAARIVGLALAVRVAHVMEDCFTAAKEGSISLTSDDVDVLLQGVDALQRVCSPQADGPLAEASLESLVARLRELGHGQGSAQRAALPVHTAAAETVPVMVQAEEPSVTLPSVFDEASAEVLRITLIEKLARQPARISLDFAQVGELSAAGLAFLVSFVEAATAANPPAAIEARRIGPGVRTVVRAAGLDRTMGIGR